MPDLIHFVIPVALIFVLAGLVKGVTGMGLPTVSMGLLGLMMVPAQAAALLVVPATITNVWQYATGPNRLAIARRLGPMLLAIALATWSASSLITGDDSGEAVTGLGLALIIYALMGLTRYRLKVPPRSEDWLGPIVGAGTGIVTGATGVFVIPAVPYIQALGLEADDLVQALGLSFTVSTLALAAGLFSHGALRLEAGGVSFACTVPALAGMAAGQWLRRRVNAETFRKLFFAGLFILGAELASRAVFA
jgi:uncharacterized membrane protein YfcA